MTNDRINSDGSLTSAGDNAANDNTALIAGVVAAFVAGAIITGVVVGLVCKRRSNRQPVSSGSQEMHTARNEDEPTRASDQVYQYLSLADVKPSTYGDLAAPSSSSAHYSSTSSFPAD